MFVPRGPQLLDLFLEIFLKSLEIFVEISGLRPLVMTHLMIFTIFIVKILAKDLKCHTSF